MNKIANGRGIAVDLVAEDQVNGLKLIGRRLCRIISKQGNRGVVAMDGVVSAPKQNSQAWTQFQQLYWDATNSRLTTDEGSNVPAALAAAPAAADAVTGHALLNGLPAIWGD